MADKRTDRQAANRDAAARDGKDRRRRRRRPRPRSRGKRFAQGLGWTVGVAAAAAVIVVIAMNPPWRPTTAVPTTSLTTPAAPAPTGTITVPGAGDTVADDVTARGTVHDVPAGSVLWVVAEVVGPDGHPYWEQNKTRLTDRAWPGPQEASRLANDEWQALVPIGNRIYRVTGLRLRISLVVADATVDAAFRQYNLTADSKRNPGISPVPSGLTVLDAVVVTIDLGPVIR